MNQPDTDYQAPIGHRIPATKRTRPLYRAEADQQEAIMVAARELMLVLRHSEDQFWTHTMPEALLGILDGFDPHAAVLAARIYLEKQGYTVEERRST